MARLIGAVVAMVALAGGTAQATNTGSLWRYGPYLCSGKAGRSVACQRVEGSGLFVMLSNNGTAALVMRGNKVLFATAQK